MSTYNSLISLFNLWSSTTAWENLSCPLKSKEASSSPLQRLYTLQARTDRVGAFHLEKRLGKLHVAAPELVSAQPSLGILRAHRRDVAHEPF